MEPHVEPFGELAERPLAALSIIDHVMALKGSIPDAMHARETSKSHRTTTTGRGVRESAARALEGVAGCVERGELTVGVKPCR